MRYTAKDIIALFAYTEKEQATFPYIRRYMDRVQPFIHDIQNDAAKLHRYALAGLFLTYRSCNHIGTEMSTQDGIPDGWKDGIHKNRMIAYRDFFGRSIDSQRAYLASIRFNILKLPLLRNGKFLARFVLTGK